MEATFGSNELFASASFEERTQYIKKYPAGLRNFRTVDFWYEDNKYGRVNTLGETVYPSEARLKQLRGTGDKPVYVLDFVADAYEGFRAAMRYQESRDNFFNLEGTPFETLFFPTKGWVSVNKKYTQYAQSFYERSVFPYCSNPDVGNDIIDFDGFIEAFTRLIDRVTLSIPFTKTEYIESKYASPLMSGLVIEFSGDYKHGEDNVKANDFMNNMNFELYRDIANRHGFALDKNAPWRLIALPGYPRMQDNMNKYDVELDTLFTKYYYTSYMVDLPSLKSLLFQFYNFFITDFPVVRVPTVREIKNRRISLTKVIPRAKLDPQHYIDRYDDLFWIRLYAYIRAKETNRDWNQHKFDHVVKEASDFFTYSSEKSALKFINKEMTRLAVDEAIDYRRGSFRFKRKRRYHEQSG